MTQEQMNVLVPEKLSELEAQHGVKVLLAVESGSRAWGLESPDSDFDVRFVYVRRRDFYLQLEKRRDVIETPVDDTWDVNGWDLDKTLRQLFRCNPTLYEWVRSPVVYRNTGFAARIQPLLEAYFSPESMLFHYVNTARNNIKAFLRRDLVRPKKYFYAIRPLLACLWVLEHNSPPPVLFSELASAELPAALRPAVDRLLDMKTHGPEKLEITPVPEIDRWMDETIGAVDAAARTLPAREGLEWGPLNRFFLEELGLSEG